MSANFPEETTMKQTLLIIIAAAFALSACNTVQGVGKDIKKGGEAIEKAAK
jgi:predicted small secreted protein